MNTILDKNKVLEIVKKYQYQYNLGQGSQISDINLNTQFDVKGGVAWIVTSQSQLFGEVKEYFYVVSDKTAEVEYTMNEYGKMYPHIK